MEELSIQQVCGWFEANKEKSIMIKKEDQEDIDQIEIEVHEIGLMNFTDTEDAYLSPQAIVLRGSGSIATHDGEKQKLPEDSYEIPFSEHFHGVQRENSMEIQTELATYFITTD
ncbi:hypothetical protein [Paenibacillus sedimenti]|uniref:Uncharacterized protein n=1 Tax=Paenibacillus sedimenti TaxID=2770274 RepID=A0A926KTD0_9BACL|nr:hypothetical protein [Paenibacillus sedimenti]MBD0383137.1 hypothetical protein [Paenibacillus sedimenti]